MILRKIRQLVNEFRKRQEQVEIQNEKILTQINILKEQNNLIISENAELEWAAIYHDTINDKEWLKNLRLSPGRWAANYSLFYILVRILTDYRPKKILELGLGESSKLISSYLDNQLKDSKHVIIEHDDQWIDHFKKRFELSKNSEIFHLPIETKIIKDFQVNSYKEIEKLINQPFDLYVIDGPFGSERFSRYDVCLLAEYLNKGDEFIIIIDDYNRIGERETVTELSNCLTTKGIAIHKGKYGGAKHQLIIGTEKYKFATSI